MLGEDTPEFRIFAQVAMTKWDIEEKIGKKDYLSFFFVPSLKYSTKEVINIYIKGTRTEILDLLS